MFSVGDKVAHPLHGAGVIEQIVTETVAGSTQDYYVFRLPAGGLELKIPTATSELVGLRRIWEAAQTKQLLKDLPSLEMELPTGSWNQRNRKMLDKLKSGDLYQVARIIKGLLHRDGEKGLSVMERKMLRTAKQILISEVVLSIDRDYREIEELVYGSISGGV